MKVSGKNQGWPAHKRSRKLEVNLRVVLGPAGPQKKVRIRRVEQAFLSR